ERITSRRSTLRTLPALREEALPRPWAQRMCCGVHTESSADRSEMGKIVLSPNMPMTNTRAIWLRFGAFLSPPAPSHRIYWPLCFRPTLDASRPTPDQRGQVVRRAPRWLLPDTNRRFVKDRTEPDRDERPLYFSMSPNRAIAADKSIRFFPPRCRTTVDHSLVVGGAGRQWL